MLKKYTIEIIVDDESYPDIPMTFTIDKSKDMFNQMIRLVESTVALLENAEFIDDVTSLRIYSDEDVLFESLDSFYTYMAKHKIEGFLEPDLSTYIVVNGFRYRGQVLEEMVLLEDLKEDLHGIPS